MSFNIEYSCHTITNIKHGRRLSLQLMTNLSLTCNYSNACLGSEVVCYTENQITKLQTEENKALRYTVRKCKKMYCYKRIKGGRWTITSSNQRHEDKNPLYQTYVKRQQLIERNILTTV